MRASGVRPSDFAYSSSSTTTAAAPSLRGQELPAVTLPSSLKAGLSVASTSRVVSGLIPSSWLTSLPSGVATVMISRSKMPVSRALVARIWLLYAYSSISWRETPYCSATFSAVIPIVM